MPTRSLTMILVLRQIVICAFDFGSSNALAQTTAVCSNTPHTGERVECTESAGSTTTIDIDLEGFIVAPQRRASTEFMQSMKGRWKYRDQPRITCRSQ